MGKVIVKIKVTNRDDLTLFNKGIITADQVRWLELEGVVDTGATGLALPISVIEKLGLMPISSKSVQTTNGLVKRRTFSEVVLEIQGRDDSFRVAEVPNDVPPLIGQLPLEALDFVVDPKSRALIGNPAHGGQWIWEEL
jgi:predicted aspartyl protease